MPIRHEVSLTILAASVMFAGCGGKVLQTVNGISPEGASGGGGVSGAANATSGGGATSGRMPGPDDTSGGSGTAGTSVLGGAAGTGGALAQFMPIANSFCTAARTCCAKGGLATMLPDCETAFFTPARPEFALVEQGTVTVDSAALARCQAAYQQAASECNVGALIKACKGVFLGTKGVGEACTTASECRRDQGPRICSFLVDDARVGSCKKVLRGKSGDACLSSCRTGEDCSYEGYLAGASITCFEADGLYCDNSADTPVCKPIIPTGGTCSSDDACGTRGFCETTCQPNGVMLGACERRCERDGLDLVCVAGQCEAPSFTSGLGNICNGYSPAP